MMKKVIKYECKFCGKLFAEKEACEYHEDRHELINTANKMLEGGFTLKEINRATHIWSNVPDYLENVNKDNCFVISHLQGCSKPAYRINKIEFDRELYLWGCGSWTGYCGSSFSINDNSLKNPRPKDEFFIDKRYEKIYF